MAGLIAAAGNNRNGIAGTAWGAKILPVVVACDNGSHSIRIWLEGFSYLGEKRPDLDLSKLIINASVGYYNEIDGPLLCEGIRDWLPSTLIVAAAGNEGLDITWRPGDPESTPVFPASCGNPNIITVTASNKMARLYYPYNYSTTTVDLAAPGVSILTTALEILPGLPLPPGGGEPPSWLIFPGYGWMKGTSASAALVSGAAALLASGLNNYNYLSLKEAILSTGTYWPTDPPANGNLPRYTVTGKTLNICRALWKVKQGRPGFPPQEPCVYYPWEEGGPAPHQEE